MLYPWTNSQLFTSQEEALIVDSASYLAALEYKLNALNKIELDRDGFALANAEVAAQARQLFGMKISGDQLGEMLSKIGTNKRPSALFEHHDSLDQALDLVELALPDDLFSRIKNSTFILLQPRFNCSIWQFKPTSPARLARLIHDGGVVRVDWGLAALAT